MLSNLPKTWDDVYLDQFMALKKLDNDVSFYLRQSQVLAILTDTLPEDECWEDMDVEELTSAIKGLGWLKFEPSSQPVNSFNGYTAIDIEKLTFGEWIDLEHYFQDYFENLPIIAAIIYRLTKQDEWGNIVYQKNNSYNLQKRADSFLELPITYFFWLIRYYLDFKERIMSTYETLFEPVINEEDLDEENIEDYDPDMQKQIEYEETAKKWSWENILYKLANGDVTKYDQITDMPFIFIMNQLSFQKEMQL